jgi:hypothetical protein
VGWPKQARLAELEFAKTVLEQQRAQEREAIAAAAAARHERRLQLWSKYLTLDRDIASIDSLEGQVKASRRDSGVWVGANSQLRVIRGGAAAPSRRG